MWLIPFGVLNLLIMLQNFRLDEKRMSWLLWYFIALTLLFFIIVVVCAVRDHTQATFNGLT